MKGLVCSQVKGKKEISGSVKRSIESLDKFEGRKAGVSFERARDAQEKDKLTSAPS